MASMDLSHLLMHLHHMVFISAHDLHYLHGVIGLIRIVKSVGGVFHQFSIFSTFTVTFVSWAERVTDSRNETPRQEKNMGKFFSLDGYLVMVQIYSRIALDRLKGC